MPKVSVIVPSYNYAEYIGECISSVLGQEGFSDFELIVVDDASRDASWEVIRSFDDPRMVCVRHETNQGHVRTFNEGFSLARGRYLVHIGSDDFWHPRFLARCMEVFEAHPEVGLVHTNFAMVESDGTVSSPRATDVPVPGGYKGSELAPLLYGNYLPPVGTIFRREGLDLIGGRMSEELAYGEDWRLWLAIARKWECYFLDEVLAFYRVHDRNLHTGLQRSRDGEESDLRILDEVFADPDVPAEVRRQRGRVYASHFRRFADGYFGFGMAAECRRCLRSAARWEPTMLLRPDYWRRYLAASLPRNVYRHVQQSYRRLAASR